jgi:acid phosphatase type 7
VSRTTRHLPWTALLLAATVSCALLITGAAAAATRSFSPASRHGTTLVFKLKGVVPDQVQAGYLQVGGRKRKLDLDRVLQAARRGTLRLHARLHGRHAKLILVTSRVGLSTTGSTSTGFAPNADAYTSADHPATNYGTSTILRPDGSPIRNGYLRFDVSGLSDPVTKATLRLYSRSNSSTGITLHGVSDNNWSETGITYANAPAVGASVASSGKMTSGTYLSLDATSLVKGNGVVTMALKTTSSSSKSLDSREGKNKPSLIVETTPATTTSPTDPISSTGPISPTDPTSPPTADVQPAFPIRAAFYYPWYPETWTVGGVLTHFTPTLGYYSSTSTSVIQQHVNAMQYAGIEAGISSWWGQGDRTDARFATLLSTTNAMASPFRWSLYYENESTGDPSVATIASDLAYIRDHYGSDPSSFRVNGRFVVFVYSSGSDGCGMADRWKQANAGINAYIVLKVFSGYKLCASQPDNWHQYGPATAAISQPGYSYSISPGFWKADELTPRLARDLTRFQGNVRDMVASNAPFQLVTTFNEWGEGTAVESATDWASSSGFGDYLDALHNNGQTSSAPPPPPANLAPTASFTVSPNPALTGQSVTFNGAGSSDSDGSIADYKWDLDGNGTFETDSGSSATISRSYSSAATITVKLRVTDNAGATADATRSLTINAPAPPPSSGDPVIAAAGDIACDPADGSFNSGNGTASSCRQKYTSDLLVGAGLAKVLTLGDNQYEDNTLAAYTAAYDPTWGRVKSLIKPSIGNHEYQTSAAAGYFDYFNGVGNSSGQAGERGKGYNSFDVGDWHLIELNSNCSNVSCSAGSPQEQWLRADLAAHSNACTLAYWHHPRFSSGTHGNNSSVQTLWQALYDGNADVVLNGHDHLYERFGPQDAAGAPDSARGIREFVVGTGGKNHYSFNTPQPNSEVRNSDTYGVIKLTLHPSSYDWHFEPEAGKSFSDSGSGNCH